MLLYRKMKEMRNQNGWTQQQLSDRMNIERSTYANYENGSRRVPYGILKKFATAFNVTTDHVLEGVEDSEADATGNNDEWREIRDKLQEQLKLTKEKIRELQEQETQIISALKVIGNLSK